MGFETALSEPLDAGIGRPIVPQHNGDVYQMVTRALRPACNRESARYLNLPGEVTGPDQLSTAVVEDTNAKPNGLARRYAARKAKGLVNVIRKPISRS